MPTSPDRRRALRRFSRRKLLGALGVAGAGLVLAACSDGEEEPGVSVDPQSDAEATAQSAAQSAGADAAPPSRRPPNRPRARPRRSRWNWKPSR